MAKKREAGHTADALYAAPPKEFTATRARLVKELKAADRGDEAREIAKMKRLPASVWAVNQLARRAPDEVAELLELGAGLRSAEKRLLKGGPATDFMADARTARQKVAALARRAEALLEEAGHKPTAPMTRTISQTLQAASVADDETRAALGAGRLTRDLAPASSFGGGDLSSALTASVATASQHKVDRPHAARREGRHGRREAKHPELHEAKRPDKHAARPEKRRDAKRDEKRQKLAELRERRREQAAARKQAAALRRTADAADRLVADRSREVEKARALVERAETELRAAKDALADAETAARAARRAADAAKTD
ncbi:MAG: hypothetical protein JWN44_2665 [Myxococcales bacterium]|nr:hypothetical protein [Myxococcales bacterium]